MERMGLRDVICQKLADTIASKPVEATSRDIKLTKLPRRAHAIIGMRRAGKTSFLHQCLQERLAAGTPREALVYFSFEDERLGGLTAAGLNWILEEYFARYPQFRDGQKVTFFFDEIQVVPGWETFVRRILDSESLEVFVSGSSAKMLSREVATSLRGRATETTVFPFSFREFLRHRGIAPPEDPAFVPKAQRSQLDRLCRAFITEGGFPEAQELPDSVRVALLQSYVDTVIFRDVVERHNVTSIVALRRLTRQLLGASGGLFSIHRFLNDLKSQGVAASKDTLHALLGHLEDAFLVRMVPMATSSERQRQSNPRKIYPVDAGLGHAFDRSGKANVGHALENLVEVELERRGCELGYVRTEDGFEVGFLATPRTGAPLLMQVCAELNDPAMVDRELRALEAARAAHPRATRWLITLGTADAMELQAQVPKGTTVKPAWQWFLEGEPAA
ncbi:MAG: ATP-binding protein [Acidobacteria bacterium]|nr:ATP-binding protein [Acidobacteriota bacterium]